jgi:uncharacterized membrane protein YbhN (UPF0104 family)
MNRLRSQDWSLALARHRSLALARPRRLVLALTGLILAAVLISRLSGGGGLAGAARRLAHPAPGWIAVAIACALMSYLLYAAAQRRLLGGPGRRLGIRWLASLAVCAQALSNFLPGGYIAANLLNFRELNRRGLSATVSGWVLVMSSGLYLGALACLVVLGGQFVGIHAPAGLGDAELGARVLLGVIGVLAVVAWLSLRFGILQVPAGWRRRLTEVPRSGRSTAVAGALFTGCWLADAGCLVAALQAVAARPAWSVVPLAYCAAQLASFVPITPGGVGLVEGSLAATLLAGTGGASRLLAAVLLYRIVSYWATLPCGALGYLAVRRSRQAKPVAAPASTSLECDGQQRQPASSNRATGGDRPGLVLEG